MKMIVIADDSSTARMIIRRCLEIAGLQDAVFLEAENGKQALEHFKKNIPDLLVTDLIMPEMGGEELLRKLKLELMLKDLPVLVISSAKNEAKTKELEDLGAFAVLPKPINPAVIAEALQALLPDSPQGGDEW